MAEEAQRTAEDPPRHDNTRDHEPDGPTGTKPAPDGCADEGADREGGPEKAQSFRTAVKYRTDQDGECRLKRSVGEAE